MGLAYRYLLFFERDARLDALEILADMAEPGPDEPTTLVLPDRTLPLPFSAWVDTGTRLAWDDPSPTWDLLTSLCFEPDEEVEAYLDRLYDESAPGATEPGDGHYDGQGRAAIGYIDLSVHNDMSEWPSGTGDDLVLFEFGTPGSTMSVLFWESASIRRAFTHLLETCRGVYGLLDLEDMGADLFWLRGSELDLRLPTAEMPLAEIEGLAADSTPLPFSFQSEQVAALARRHLRASGGVELGTHHWRLALFEAGHDLPGPPSGTGSADGGRRRLDRGDAGAPLPEDELRERANSLARRAGDDLVTLDHVARVVAVRQQG